MVIRNGATGHYLNHQVLTVLFKCTGDEKIMVDVFADIK